ncbi:hypothetical protein Clacol_002895 [Clathrus columnatus]|uniref:Xylose isomerase-like TIM barrel domain-containing protein n=1 Tax=Clathrus columnatus TaxID=1419009 RepID=A0AAV5A7Y9_9AGAM|nr:hypothetical protein Clacol_002895 [Clathrus columnatus]
MRSKLEAASRSGFTAIDLFDTDWEKFKHDYAVEHNLQQSIIDGDPTSMAAAKAVNFLCTSYGIKLLCLQPFREFEARRDPIEAAERMHAARGAISILPLLGCDMLLIPSTTLPVEQLVNDVDRMSIELGELADYAASLSPNETRLRICYEALSWGTFVSTWKHAWEVVKRANRPNLGLCLDSFNTAAREWADPYHPTGIQQPTQVADFSLHLSLSALKEVPSNKIFYFQVADGKFMTPLLLPQPIPPSPC